MMVVDEKLKSEWWILHPKLRLILCDIDYFCQCRGYEPIATCFERTRERQKELFIQGLAASEESVHIKYGRFVRGADLDDFPGDLNAQCELYINSKYQYDPRRPKLKTFYFHKGTGWHNHIQVRHEDLPKLVFA